MFKDKPTYKIRILDEKLGDRNYLKLSYPSMKMHYKRAVYSDNFTIDGINYLLSNQLLGIKFEIIPNDLRQ